MTRLKKLLLGPVLNRAALGSAGVENFSSPGLSTRRHKWRLTAPPNGPAATGVQPVDVRAESAAVVADPGADPGSAQKTPPDPTGSFMSRRVATS